MMRQTFYFAGFSLDLRRLALHGPTGEVSLRPKSFEVLRHLVGHSGQVVTKDELIAAVWPDVTVTDESVTRCISDIRRALDDEEQRIIKTISRRGYLLDVPVEVEDRTDQSGPGKTRFPAGDRQVASADVPSPDQDAPRSAPTRPYPSQGAAQGHGPERRQITIMVCSLADAAAHSARLDPEDLHELISAFHRTVRAVIERHGGFNARSTTDRTVAYFGYPLAHEDDAERAVHAALAAEKAVAALIPARIPGGVKARIGIATGLVVVGNAGAEGTTPEHVLAGEAPLLAASLSWSAKPGTIVIAAGTRRQLGGLFEYRDLDLADQQRGAELTDASIVLRESTVVNRFDALQRSGSTPFVGRVDELETLQRLWGQAASVAGRVVQIVGEAGIGKSRLTQALLDRLAAEPYVRLRYFCQPNYTDSPLHPIIGQISVAAGIERQDDAQQRLAKLEQLLRNARQSLTEKVPLLAPLLSIPLGPDYAPLTLNPQRRKERTFGALIDLLSGVADSKTILMVFEDAHWIDPTSLELLAHLVDRIPDMPLMLIITARPEFVPSWPMHSHVSLLHLGRLGQADGEALAQGVVSGRRLPPELLREISNHTDGIPLFVEELTKSVLESGLLKEDGDSYVLTEPLLSLSIPSTLHASLLARLDRLGPSKRVAQIAAVVGREFSYGLITGVAGLPEHEMSVALDRLVSTGLVFRRGLPPDATYYFKHALMRDAAYASLLRGNRRELHGAIVDHLTARNVSDEPVKPELIGHHCAEAGKVEAAIGHFLVAGSAAVARSALSESSALFEKALAQVAKLPEGPVRDARELEILSARGASLIAIKGYGAPETGRAYARAKELWDRLGKPLTQVHIVRGLWLYHLGHGAYGKAQALAEEVNSLSRHSNDIEGEILSLHCLGAVAMFRGRLAEARKIMVEAHHLYDSNAGRQLFKHQPGYDPNILGLALLAWTLSLLGLPEQAAQRSQESLRRAHRSARALDIVSSLEVRAKLPLPTLSDSDFSASYETMQTLAEQHGFPYWIAEALIIKGELALRRGHAIEAVSILRQGVDAQRAGGATFWSSHHAIQLSSALGQAQRPDEAIAILDRAIEAAEDTEDRWYLAELLRRRALLYLTGKSADQARGETELNKALEIAREQTAKLWELRAATSLARLWQVRGQTAKARKLLGPVYAWFTEGLDTADLLAAKALLDELGN